MTRHQPLTGLLVGLVVLLTGCATESKGRSPTAQNALTSTGITTGIDRPTRITGSATGPTRVLSSPTTTEVIATVDGPGPEGVAAPLPPKPDPAASVNDLDPLAVATAHLAAWCWMDPAGPVEGNLQAAARWTTWAGSRADIDADGLDVPSRQAMIRAGVGRGCDNIRVAVADQAPNASTVTWVLVTARRMWWINGLVTASSELNQTRRMVLDNGRWRIDRIEQAG